jgi:hypothetical protein
VLALVTLLQNWHPEAKKWLRGKSVLTSQARNIREEVAAAAELRLAAAGAPPAQQEGYGGVVMGLAGLLGWHLHPDALSRLLS